MSDLRQTKPPLLSPLGSMPGGLEFPPRRYPPDPQHLDIPQTYDPRPSVQLERTRRDIAAGTPGAAAREDAERATVENPRGSPPPSRGVESVTERDTPVTFSTHFASYNAGETAAFTADEAARLAELGVTEGGGATAPPTNTTVPQVSQTGDTLNCTMGEWTGEPTSYAYQWQMGGSDVGTDTASYTVLPANVGETATCIVTATNANGSASAPPSNGVVVT
jgi:hypothetical protein